MGAASRDIAEDDPRGWRLGGGVTYSALLTARLGLRTGALIGLDADAADAEELDLLRDAGVSVVPAMLGASPVFRNVERPEGRLQLCGRASDPLLPAALPAGWLGAPAWILAPVAGEVPDPWADLPGPSALLAVGWQGLLRVLEAGRPVGRRVPFASALLRRADLVGVSRDDLDPRLTLADLCALLRPGAMLALTRGERGGLAMEASPGGPRDLRRYPAIPTRDAVDPTGAGDVFLATLAAARAEPRLAGRRRGEDVNEAGLRLAAAASSLVLEGPGLRGVPMLEAVLRRARGGARPFRRPPEPDDPLSGQPTE